jgi:CheY-like chemotaxis protein
MDANIVLIVDDSPVARMGLRHMVAGLSVHTLEVECGEDAIERIESGMRPVHVFLDLSMPGIGGLETLKFFAKTWPEIDVSIITGDLNQQIINSIQEVGSYAIMRKPAEKAKIHESIKKSLEKRATSI